MALQDKRRSLYLVLFLDLCLGQNQNYDDSYSDYAGYDYSYSDYYTDYLNYTYNINLDPKYTCAVDTNFPYNSVPYAIIGHGEYGTWLYSNTVAYIQFQKNRLSADDFKIFCSNSKFRATEFQILSHDIYCEKDKFLDKCGGDVSDDASSSQKQFYNTCQMVYDSYQIVKNTSISNQNDENEKFNQLGQLQVSNIPACGFQFYGFTEDFFTNNNNPSAYDFLPTNCRASIVTSQIFIFILMLLIIFCNVLVMMVILKYQNKGQREMFFGGRHDGSADRNVLCCSFFFKSWSNFKHLKNQTAIKLALAFTDLLTGLFVFPSMFVINHFAYFRGMEFRGFYDCVEESPFGLSRGFVNFFGFFQIFTITIFWGGFGFGLS